MMNKTAWIPVATALLFGASHVAADPVKPGPVAAADMKWQALVPQLGAKGPQISVVFGDLKKGPVGLLLKLPAGFTPGPHTHSSEYTGVVIYGELTDFDPGQGAAAEKLAPGGRWIEPANHPHDNLCSAKGECLEYVYFAKGFDMKPFAPAKK